MEKGRFIFSNGVPLLANESKELENFSSYALQRQTRREVSAFTTYHPFPHFPAIDMA